MRTSLQDLLSTGAILMADGGMGTTLFSMGLNHGDSPELWNLNEPDNILQVHRDYIAAGAQIILTNTFGGNRLRMELHKIADRVAEVNTAAAKLAIQAAEEADRPIVVAGDIGPSGGLIVPLGELSYEEAVDVFAEQAQALYEAGIDVFWVETMSAHEEVLAAVEGIRRAAPADFPVVTTMTFDTNGRTMMGITPHQALEQMQAMNVIALGGNCGNGPDEILTVIDAMHEADSDQVLVAKANAGIPHLEHGVPVYDGTPEIMAEYAISARSLGAQIIGACCGSTPAHIQTMKAALDDTPLEHHRLTEIRPDLAALADAEPAPSARRRSRARERARGQDRERARSTSK